MNRTQEAIQWQVEALYRAQYARELADLAINGHAKDNGALRGRAIAAQETAKKYGERARSLAEPMPTIPVHRLVSVRSDL
jgi:hypothetical protein